MRIDTWSLAQVWGSVESVSINSVLGFGFRFDMVARLCCQVWLFRFIVSRYN